MEVDDRILFPLLEPVIAGNEDVLLLLYVSLAAYILALIGFGLFSSALCSTQQQAFLGVFCFIMPAALLRRRQRAEARQ